jgi:hypothetical protein
VYWSALTADEVPLGLVTVTSTVPAVPGGDVTVSEVSELTVKLVTVAPPKATLVAPVKPVPVRVTEVPPAVEPELGEIPLTVGTPG